MLKKEIVWREILFSALEKGQFEFQQKDLAEKFNFSLSTVFNALKAPRSAKALQVSGRGFRLVSAEKMLYLWATERNLEKDIIYSTYFPGHPGEIEGSMPDKIIWGIFSAYNRKFGEAPSEYGKVYVYADEKKLEEIEKRFPKKRGPANVIVLRRDKYLDLYSSSGTLAQIFVDVWNTGEWYAGEFLDRLKIKMDL
ncbi:MAG: hypothetical protein U5L10_00710 [Candidatus Moranbacteria bacterium]|nr:hypothetical protein [Candidatus Moranbacteria bacterium]